MLKAIRLLERSMSGIAALALIAMIVVSVANAVGRTWMNTPIYGANEMSAQWFLPLTVLLAIPSAQVWKEHYTVAIITERLRPRSLALLKCLGYSASAVVCSAVTWFGYQEARSNTEVAATAGITSLPVYPFYYLVPACFALAALVYVCDAALAFRSPMSDLNTGTGEPLHADVADAA